MERAMRWYATMGIDRILRDPRWQGRGVLSRQATCSGHLREK